MKNPRSTVLALLTAIFLAQTGFCQLQKTASTDLKIASKDHVHLIQFDEPRSNLLFSLPPVNGMLANRSFDKVAFSLYGINEVGHKIMPVVSHLDKTERYIHIADDAFSINPAILSDLDIYFPEPVSAIALEAESSIRPSYVKAMYNQNYYFKNKINNTINPATPSCIDHIAIVLDLSHSMKDVELNALESAIENWVTDQARTDTDLDLSLVTFDTGASIAVNKLNINHQKSQHKIIKALHKAAQPTSSSKNTDWSIGLEEVATLGADLVLFITDSPPNALKGSKTDRANALSEAIIAADQIKLNGTRIITVGSDMLVEDNAIQWFNFITSGDASTGLIHPNSWDDYDIPSLDYVIVPDFLDLEYILNNIEHHCTKAIISAPVISDEAFTIYPNPASDKLALHISDFVYELGYAYRIVGTDGKVIQSRTIQNSTEIINIQYLPAANYFIQVMNQDNIIVYANRFVKVEY